MDGPRGAVSLLRDDEFGVSLDLALALRVVLVVLGAMEEENHVGILLDGPGLSQVAHHGPVVRPGVHRAVQLRKRDDRDLELPGQRLEVSTDVGDLLLAALIAAGHAPGHQLEVVHQNERDVLALLEAPGPGPDGQRTERGRVIDEDLRLGESGHGTGELAVILVGEETAPEPAALDLGPGAEEVLHHLLLAHLHGEQHHRLLPHHGDVLHEAECKGRLAHGRATGHDGHLTGLQPAGHLVQVEEPGLEPGDAALAVLDPVDLEEDFLEDVSDGR
jgi:hypothetical protein